MALMTTLRGIKVMDVFFAYTSGFTGGMTD